MRDTSLIKDRAREIFDDMMKERYPERFAALEEVREKPQRN
jgi:hypothetical protein